MALVGNLNPSYIMETVVRQMVGSYTELPALLANMNYYANFKTMDPSTIDYFYAGVAAGQIAKLFLDFTLDN